MQKGLTTNVPKEKTETPNTGRIGLRRIPSRRNAEATYQKIVDAAHQIIAEEGLDQLTTQGIAERAGISQGSLYQYFSNKESVLYHIAENRIERLRLSQSDPRKTSYAHWVIWLEQLIDETWQVYQAEPEIVRHIELISTMPEIRELYDQHNLRTNQYIMDCLRHYLPTLPATSANTDEDALKVTAEYIRATITGVLGRSVDLEPEQAQQMLRLLKRSLVTVIANALNC